MGRQGILLYGYGQVEFPLDTDGKGLLSRVHS